jgi:3-oxoacyl-(acyl-carrier-protein) synthase
MTAAPVAVAGWGTVCALGPGTVATVARLRAGERALAPPARSPHVTPANPTVLVGEVPLDVPLEQRARTIVATAVDEAVVMSGPLAPPVGVFVGTTGGFFVDAEVDLYRARQRDPAAMPAFGRRGPGEVAAAVAAQVGARGPVLTYSMACTSSAAALAAAGTHVATGNCTTAVVVGFDMLSSLVVHGFRSLMLVDPRPCRPFDRSRAGLQPGEGCGALVLRRGEGPFRLVGSANAIDTGNLTASSTDGATVERVVRAALRDAGVEPAQVRSVKAHGTGTVDNDLAEGRGLVRALGASPPPTASLKGAIGHTLGAAGALEAALWMACLSAGFVPASSGFSEPDLEIGMAPIAAPLPAPRGAHLLDAFGFGGSCVALVLADA